MTKTIDRTTKPTRLAPARAQTAGLPLLATLLGLAATAVAAWGSWIPSLWGDEVTSLMSAERPVASLLTMLRHVDAVHGTYYLGLHGWIGLFGTSPFAIRFPSAIAVGLTVAAVVVIAWRLGTPRLAVIAGIVCCVVPRVTYMGEEARSYAFSAAFVSWLTVVLLELIRRENPRRMLWVAYGALLAVGTYVFLYVALFAVVHAVVLVSMRAPRGTLRRWATTVGVGFVAVVPVATFAILERKQIAYLASHDQLAPSTVFSTLWFGSPWFAVPAWALIGVALWSSFRARVRAAAPVSAPLQAVPSIASPGLDTVRTRSSESPVVEDVRFELASASARPSIALVAGTWLLVPTLMLMLGSAVIPSFTARYVSFCAPAAALLIAAGIDAIARSRRASGWRWVGVGLVAVVVAAPLPSYVAQRGPYAKNDSDWSVVSRVIGSHARPGDAVVFDETAHPSKDPRLAMHAYPAGFAATRDVTLDTAFTQNDGWGDRAYGVATAASLGRFDLVQRVWLIEYADGTADTYGYRDLERLGFEEVGVAIRTHRELIVEFER